MLSGFRDIFRIPELKKRVLFTLAIIAVFRIGAFVPTPGIDTSALVDYFRSEERRVGKECRSRWSPYH